LLAGFSEDAASVERAAVRTMDHCVDVQHLLDGVGHHLDQVWHLLDGVWHHLDGVWHLLDV
jgi:hypothetical protein